MIPVVPLSQSLVFLNLLTSSCSSGTKGRISSTRRTVPTAAGWSWSKSRAQPAAGSGWAACSPELCPSSSVSRGGCSAQSAWLCARWVPKLLAELAGLQCPSVPSALVTAFLVTKCFPGAFSVGRVWLPLLPVPPRSCQHLSHELQAPAASPGSPGGSPSLGEPPAHPTGTLCWELCQHQGCSPQQQHSSTKWAEKPQTFTLGLCPLFPATAME